MANTNSQIEQRVKNLERNLSSFQRMFFSLFSSSRDSQNTDEKVWQSIKEGYERVQEKMFKARYPSLYAKLKK